MVKQAEQLEPSKNDGQSRLKLLIAKGKEQGFLTYHEVNDHLPDDIVDPEQVEDIINMINDMGIKVYESPPDLDIIMTDSTEGPDEEAAAEAAAALASVESEFGRTTDPVRMYMREMGTVDLLTREGEIKIAKRIEEGINQALAALACYPGTIDSLLDAYNAIESEELKLSDIIVGFTDTEEYPDDGRPPVVNTPDENISTESSDEEAEGGNDDDTEDESEATLDPEELCEHIITLEKLYTKMAKSIKRYGHDYKKFNEQQDELCKHFLGLRLTPKFINHLIQNIRNLVDIIRTAERTIMKLCVSLLLPSLFWLVLLLPHLLKFSGLFP